MTEYICEIEQRKNKDFVLEFICEITLIFPKKYCNLIFELCHTSQDFLTRKQPHFCMKEKYLMFTSHFSQNNLNNLWYKGRPQMKFATCTQIDRTSFRLGGNVFAAKAWRLRKQCFTVMSGTFFFNKAAKSDLFLIMAGGTPSVNTDLNFSHFI